MTIGSAADFVAQAASTRRAHRHAARTIAGTSLSAALFITSAAAFADAASGTITYQTKSAGVMTVAVKHAYLMKGPDFAAGKAIRRVVLSVADAAPSLNACDNMMCSDGGIGEGMTLDLDAGRRLNYWIVGNAQRVQYSGTADSSSLILTADTPQRVAGKLAIDDRAAGGPQIQVEFDATLVKEVTKDR
jgi:hypothetical protein